MIDGQVEQAIRLVYTAMQAGSSGEDDMVGLFAPEGVLVEPFAGVIREHRGQDSIRETYREMMAAPRPPDFTLKLDRIDTAGGRILADWTCTASVMPAPLKGQDEYEFEDGKIKRLEIRLVGVPN